MDDLGDDILDVDIDADSQRGSEDFGATPPSPAAAVGSLSIAMQGYLLKKCRHGGDQKPWKRRWFSLRGSTLVYHPTREAAGALRPKVFAQLNPASTIAADVGATMAHAVAVTSGLESLWIAAQSPAEAVTWIAALSTARGEPAAILGNAPTVASPSLGQRMKMAMAGAVATSALGQALLTRYLDASARDLLRELGNLAAVRTDAKRAALLRRKLLDVCARLLVVVHEGRMPADTDLDALYEDTLSFTQDFLMYSRDQRLKEVRGPDAEVQPVCVPRLLTPLSRVACVWRAVLAGSCRPSVLTRFDDVFTFFADERLLSDLLLAPVLRMHLTAIDRALRRLMEVF